MALKDKLAAQLGDKIRATMGDDAVQGGNYQAPERIPGKHDGLRKNQDATLMPLSRLEADPTQPRKTFEQEPLQGLADSILARGILQPITARWDEDSQKWIIVLGERRFRAAGLAGLTEIPCILSDVTPTASEIALDQLIENSQRVGLPPIEQATKFKEIIDATGWSARELARRLCVDPSTVHRSLQLLTLEPTVRDLVNTGQLETRKALDLGSLEDPQERAALVDQVIRGGISRENVTETVKARKAGKKPQGKTARRTINVGGNKIIIEGPAVDEGKSALVNLLARARKQLLQEVNDQDSAAA